MPSSWADPRDAFARYRDWYASNPFDIGSTTSAALSGGPPSATSQSNGALMRSSPLGIAGAAMDPRTLEAWARADAALTHPHEVCQDANAVFVHAVAHAVRGAEAEAVYAGAVAFSSQRAPTVEACVQAAADTAPVDYQHSMGWVCIALQNALYQLLHAPSLEEGVVNSVMAGGDTDTNAAIAGALLGAVHGRDAAPVQWRDRVLTCRPMDGLRHVHRPRPRQFWPIDLLHLAAGLAGLSGAR